MTTDFRFPDVGEGIHEGELVKWIVKEGDTVKEHDVLCEIETDKAVVEIPSPVSGTILKIYHKEGDTVKVGEVLVSIGKKGEKVKAPSTKVPEPKKEKRYTASVVGQLPEAGVPRAKEILATPAVRRIAKEIGVDLAKVRGTGLGGRITEQDIRGKSNKGDAPTKKKKEVISRSSSAPSITFDKYGSVLKIPLKGVRKAIAEHMVKAWTTIPAAVAMDDIDMTEIAKRRQKEKKRAESKGYKLTFLPYIIKAVVASLKKNPYLNASLNEETGEIWVKKYFNMGIAVDTSEGLMVFVIKNVDKKSIMEIAQDLQTKSEQARAKELTLDDLKGSSFTITNWGSIGGTYGVPIINHPDVAILGTGRIGDKPIIKGRKTVTRKIMPISVSFDHRVLDGAQTARFINDLKEHLEDPDLLLIEE
jgi:pyruvate dehydrogenase E2 component (dihydrolipoamide acetyltransferase)